MVLNSDRWEAIDRLYHAALTRPVDERAAFLAEACAGDEALRREVESLLAQDVASKAALTGGAVVAAAGLVSDVGQSELTGRRLGVYQILNPILAGGMGEVYRARDTRLGREVAIKILPRAFIADTDRLARFEREARVLASLNHPHIAAIYGIEEGPVEAGPTTATGLSRPIKALILELVDGETLAERIARAGSKGLAIHEALDIGGQIADALDAAHEKTASMMQLRGFSDRQAATTTRTTAITAISDCRRSASSSSDKPQLAKSLSWRPPVTAARRSCSSSVRPIRMRP